MEILLHENIKALRKARKMTQEQLAEAMGVTVGAVHKWESKASMPEIRLLIEMADLFGVSVDVLLGYEMKSNGVEDIIDRIKACLRTKDYDNALSEAEKALLRYPNTFSVVHCCADAYERKGVETGNKDAVLRAVELMERSIPLMSQNTDPQISEVTVRSDIATCYIVLGQTDKGLEILKKYNAGGINNTLIALICSMQKNAAPEETEKYLTRGLGDFVSNAIRCMSGYINYYSHKGDMESALEASQWLANLLESLKTDHSAMCYLDKIIASSRAASAAVLLMLGRKDEAEIVLGQAYRMAAAFDSNPVYGVDAIKFCIGDLRNVAMSDDLGETAVAAVEKVLRSEGYETDVLKMWIKLKSENSVEHKEESENE